VVPGVWSFEQPMGYLAALIGNPFPFKGMYNATCYRTRTAWPDNLSPSYGDLFTNLQGYQQLPHPLCPHNSTAEVYAAIPTASDY
jgi:hypothetical protein